MSKAMNIGRVSSEEIVSMFEEAFESTVASINNIGAFGVECTEREIGKSVKIQVEISGHAGTPTIDEFKSGSVENCKTVTIERADIGEMTFTLIPSQTCFLSGNDYLIVYESN